MVRVSQEQPVIVENVIQSLTGVHANPRVEIRVLVERTASEVDAETADAYCKALFAHLSENSDDAYALEALLVLGLSHPNLLEHHRISMPQEGRRLAVLLEKRGEATRAQTLLELLVARHPGDSTLDHELVGVMKRSGNLDRLVERHLSRAEEAMREGNRREALRWLREVLALDATRRDVARMIRDLRFEEDQIRGAVRRRVKIAAAVLVAVAIGWGLVWRETSVDEAYAAIPGASMDNVEDMQRRLTAVDAHIESNPMWLGMWSAGRERSRLRNEIERFKAAQAAADRLASAERTRQETLAEAERTRARLYAEQYEFARALDHFKNSMEHAPPEWVHRAQVQRDIDAIVEWQAQQAQLAARGGTK